MSAGRRGTIIWGLLVADLVVFGGWVASLQWKRRGEELRLPVEGFDPRDLLSGHYVRFRLVAEREAEAFLGSGRTDLKEGAPLSFCLEERELQLHAVRLRTQGDACKPFLTGTWRAGRLQMGVDRFYVDERRASEVAWVRGGPDTYVVATLDLAGRPSVLDLVVEGKSVGAKRR